jgi:hypothetical protein
VGRDDHAYQAELRLRGFHVRAWFETGGFSGEEVEQQMQYFAEEVLPLLGRACGGQVKNPKLAQDLTPRVKAG